MPRAHRYYVPGHVWHITHRCHQKDFFLKFAKDRNRWRHWLFEAKKRFGLVILNYVATSNHIHLLVQDRGEGEIANSMQLVAGRVAQEYNLRKKRKGAFWEDRYHATSVATDEHLLRCLLYIDFNMVRAGVVQHPGEWPEGGYAELQSLPQRYGVLDRTALMELLGIGDAERMKAERRLWVEDALKSGGPFERDSCWTESLAVGSVEFVKGVQGTLGIRGSNRTIQRDKVGCVLRESETNYWAASSDVEFNSKFRI
jgi:putative transposase